MYNIFSYISLIIILLETKFSLVIGDKCSNPLNDPFSPQQFSIRLKERLCDKALIICVWLFSLLGRVLLSSCVENIRLVAIHVWI